MNSLHDLSDRLRSFAQARDWEQFHSPKNLAVSISIEAGELLELFQWKPSHHVLDNQDQDRVAEEMADVLIYLVRLADVMGIDLLEAAFTKLEKNEAKYPVEKSRGNAMKYTEFE